jgi:hypothetical protein
LQFFGVAGKAAISQASRDGFQAAYVEYFWQAGKAFSLNPASNVCTSGVCARNVCGCPDDIRPELSARNAG